MLTFTTDAGCTKPKPGAHGRLDRNPIRREVDRAVGLDGGIVTDDQPQAGRVDGPQCVGRDVLGHEQRHAENAARRGCRGVDTEDRLVAAGARLHLRQCQRGGRVSDEAGDRGADDLGLC